MDGGGEVMAAYFILSSARDQYHDEARLVSYSGSIQRGKMVLSLKVELDGLMIGRTLADLETILKAHKAPPAPPKRPVKPKTNGIGQTKLLALPAPDRGEGL